jgi:hypothetical protein
MKLARQQQWDNPITHWSQEWNQLLQTIPILHNLRVTGKLPASNATNIQITWILQQQ